MNLSKRSVDFYKFILMMEINTTNLSKRSGVSIIFFGERRSKEIHYY
jgi:hypothetical protein